jgi:hypothetical protein
MQRERQILLGRSVAPPEPVDFRERDLLAWVRLEAIAFHAKDALLVIDDFAPQGSSVDVARYHAAADRVFRAAGNHAGRSRLESTARFREPKPPRSLILSTGEDIPRGQSVRARLLVLELTRGSIDPRQLSRCQEEAQSGLYAEAMRGFVQWLAGRYEESKDSLDKRVSAHRGRALLDTAHARTPDIVANLQAGFELYLEFSVASEALDAGEAGLLADHCWAALRGAALAQVKHQGEAEPTSRFLALVRSALASGRAHLECSNGGGPDESPEACGWRRGSGGAWSPLGECIGWAVGDGIYLEPAAAYRIAQVVGRDAGEILTVSEQTLRKRLREKSLLASIDEARETLTVRRSLGGSSKSVLHLRRGRGRRMKPAIVGCRVGFHVGKLGVPDKHLLRGINDLSSICRKCRVFRPVDTLQANESLQRVGGLE